MGRAPPDGAGHARQPQQPLAGGAQDATLGGVSGVRVVAVHQRGSGRSSTSRKLSGKRKYSHTQCAITSTGYRCPLYDGGALPTDDPSQHDQPEDHPTWSANVTASQPVRRGRRPRASPRPGATYDHHGRSCGTPTLPLPRLRCVLWLDEPDLTPLVTGARGRALLPRSRTAVGALVLPPSCPDHHEVGSRCRGEHSTDHREHGQRATARAVAGPLVRGPHGEPCCSGGESALNSQDWPTSRRSLRNERDIP